MTATDLSSGSLGLPWGLSRSWTNGAGYAFGSTNGTGWVISQAPHLLPADGTSNDTIILVTSGTTALFYDLDESTYQGLFYDTSQLSGHCEITTASGACKRPEKGKKVTLYVTP